jgi:hypothetical protein
VVRVLAFPVLLLTAVPAIAAQGAAQSAQQPGVKPGAFATPPVKEKKICRLESSGTGSILPTRICHTQEEWNAITQSSQAQAEQMLQRQEQETVGSRN